MALFTVTNLNDSGAGSLREAIAQANVNADADTIVFEAGLTTGTTAGTNDGQIILTSGQLVITNDLTIVGDVDGDGRADISISGNNTSRVMMAEVPTTDLTLRSLDITNGFYDGNGGAISSLLGSVSIVNSTIRDSSATGAGGGVDASNLTVANSTFFNNDANTYGGAVYVGSSSGTGSFDNVTFSQNSADQLGGALSVVAATVTLRNSTITENTAPAGGGIDLFYGADATLENTILSANIAPAAAPSDKDVAINGSMLTVENSLLGLNMIPSTINAGNVFSDTPGLTGLGDFGGPVQTHALLSGSSAIGAGNAALIGVDTLDVDNDGNFSELIERDANGSARVGGTLDIGAVETLSHVVVSTLADEDDGDYSSGDLSLREAIALVDAGGTITFADTITGGSVAGVDDGVITLGGSQLTLAKSVTIDGDTNGDGKADITIDADQESQVLFIQENTGEVGLHSLTVTGGALYGGYTFGGGIHNRSGSNLTVLNSTVSGNRAGYGGGIANTGTLTLINSTVSGNEARYNGADFLGGVGGGLITAGDTTLINSTVSGNFALDASIFHSNQLTILNSTVVGAIRKPLFFEAAVARNSILVDQIAPDLTENTNNVIVNSTADAGIGALTDNGGTVETHALLSSSLAIGAGDAALLPADTFDLDGDGDTTELLSRDANGNARVSSDGRLDAGAVSKVDIFGNTPATAGAISIGSSVSGFIDFVDDTDWFAVDLVSGVTYIIDLEGASTSMGTLSDPLLRGVYDPAGVLIDGTRNDDGGFGTNSRLIFTATTTGTHFLSAAEVLGSTGSYTLSIDALAPFDLVARNVGVSTTSLAYDETFTVTYEIANIGDNASPTSKAGVYLSTDSTITRADRLLGTEWTGELDAGGFEAGTQSVELTLGTSVPGGTYFLGVIADSQGFFPETDESNNAGESIEVSLASAPVELYFDDGSFFRNYSTVADAVSISFLDETIRVDAGAYIAANGTLVENVTVTVENLKFDIGAGVTLNATLADSGLVRLTNIGDGAVTFTGNSVGNRLTGGAGNDVLLGLEGNDTLKGVEGNDTISGGDLSGLTGTGDDFVSGRGGDDSILGGDGSDTLFGGGDNDTVMGEEDNDSVFGGLGEDSLTGGLGNDTINGQDNNDTIEGGIGEDNVIGGGGNDLISGGDNNDTVAGQAGNDTLSGGEGADQITGKFGDDSIDGGGGADNIFAGAENDTVNGGAGDDTIRGEGQDDLLNGDAGNDTITGGGSRDTLNGGDDNDELFGQGGLDILNGDGGDDQLFGGDGNDDLFGGDDNDSLFGGNDNDRLDGGSGSDELRGNAGVDTFVFALGYDNDSIISFQVGTDLIELNSDVLVLSELDTVAQVLDTANGIASQTNATTVTLDFGDGDVLVVGAGSAFVISDLSGGMYIA